MVIDCHVHMVPDEIIRNREVFITEQEPEVFIIYKDPKAKLVNAEEIIDVMETQGVDKCIVFGLPWRSEKLYRLNNDYVLSISSKYPEKFIPFCCVDIAARNCFKEIQRCLLNGAKGVGELALYHNDFDYETKALLTRIGDMANSANVPVMLHTNEEVGHEYVGKSPMTLRNLYSLIKETPKTKWILAHLGGGLPFFALLKREVKEVIRNCWFDTAAIPFLYDNSVYIRLKEIIGIEKIVFGTDFPLLKPNRYYKEFENANLTLNHRRKILGENIKNILNI